MGDLLAPYAVVVVEPVPTGPVAAFRYIENQRVGPVYTCPNADVIARISRAEST